MILIYCVFYSGSARMDMSDSPPARRPWTMNNSGPMMGGGGNIAMGGNMNMGMSTVAIILCNEYVYRLLFERSEIWRMWVFLCGCSVNSARTLY